MCMFSFTLREEKTMLRYLKVGLQHNQACLVPRFVKKKLNPYLSLNHGFRLSPEFQFCFDLFLSHFYSFPFQFRPQKSTTSEVVSQSDQKKWKSTEEGNKNSSTTLESRFCREEDDELRQRATTPTTFGEGQASTITHVRGRPRGHSTTDFLPSFWDCRHSQRGMERRALANGWWLGVGEKNQLEEIKKLRGH